MGGATPGRDHLWQGGRTPVPMATGGRTPAWGAGNSSARSVSRTSSSFPQLTSRSTSLVRQYLNSPDSHVAPRRREFQRRWSHTRLQCRRRWLPDRKSLRRRQPHRQPLWRLHVLRWCFGRRKPYPSLEPHRHIILVHKRPLLLPHTRPRTQLRPHTGTVLRHTSRLEILRCAYARERFHNGADTGGTSEWRVRRQYAGGDWRGTDAQVQWGCADAV